MVVDITGKNVKTFLKRFEDLYTLVEQFCQKYGLDYRYQEINMYEELAGSYKSKEMYVYQNGEILLY